MRLDPNARTIGEVYGPAMKITDPEEAREYFEDLVKRGMRHGFSRARAIENEIENLGYYSGYHSDETQVRVRKLFNARHPIFPNLGAERDDG